MKFIFIDAENIGLKEMQTIKTSIIDKVFVFSLNSAIKEFCEQKWYACFSDYQIGANQADFRIISVLSHALMMIERPNPAITFVLYSSDKALGLAFKNECDIRSADCEIALREPLPAISKAPQTAVTPSKTDAEILFAALRKASPLDDGLRLSLSLSKQRFSQAQNELIKHELIIRCKSNKKNWRQNK
ncbi:hypothetical protein [Vibrio sp. OPT18]|uniref:hypothetical protein n=1 Tax=Vibrio sp. OPT18 TaxID=2778641 RepID=UPI00187E186B|nr:hypothetical protein [Vibrio sp. OPT18]MBE8574116.1 hypothetical protein [Vibrio sp. OPT18]